MLEQYLSIWPHLVNSVKTSSKKLSDKTQTHQRLLIAFFSIFFLETEASCRHKLFSVSFMHSYYIFGLASIWIYAFLCSNKIYNWGITFTENYTFTSSGIEKKCERKSYKLPSEVIKKNLFLTILQFMTITILLYVRNVSIGKDNISPQILLRKAVNSLLTWETFSLKLN